MADRKTLGLIGFAFSGITFAVLLIGCVVVKGHIDGRLSLEGAPRLVVSASLAKHVIR